MYSYIFQAYEMSISITDVSLLYGTYIWNLLLLQYTVLKTALMCSRVKLNEVWV